MSDFNPCRMCGREPQHFQSGMFWKASCCGCLVEAFTESESANKWNRANPVEVKYANACD